jgi:hypothetical protein
MGIGAPVSHVGVAGSLVCAGAYSAAFMSPDAPPQRDSPYLIAMPESGPDFGESD